MGNDNGKMEHKAEEVGGKAKEVAGDLSNNESLEAEGKRDQAAANLKQAGDNVKDAVTD